MVSFKGEMSLDDQGDLVIEIPENLTDEGYFTPGRRFAITITPIEDGEPIEVIAEVQA